MKQTSFMTATILASSDFKPKWLVEDFIGEGRVGSIPHDKAMDLAVALATGTDFLGEGRVPSRKRVLYFAEISKHAQTSLLLACSARRISTAEVDFFRICNELHLSDGKFARSVRTINVDVVIIDPHFFCLRKKHLAEIANVCQQSGVTPIFTTFTERTNNEN